MKNVIRIALAVSMMSFALMSGELKITFKNSKKKPEVHYHSARYSRINYDWDKRDFLIDYEKSVIYSIDHGEKRIVMATFKDQIELVRFAVANAKGTKHFTKKHEKLLGNPNEVTVKQSTGIIVGRECEKHEITVGNLVYNLYVDPNLMPDTTQDVHVRLWSDHGISQMLNQITGSTFTNLFKEIAKIRGTILKEEIGIPGKGMRTSEAISIEEGQLPDSVFEFPKGYSRSNSRIK
jgi:hypothetical protein